MPPPPQPGLSRRQTRLLLVVVLALLGVVGWFGADHWLAGRALARGREALAAGDPAAAAAALDRCLKTWPREAEAHFLAAVAARRTARTPAAKHHLEEAARNGWDKEAVAVEYALQASAAGAPFAEVEPILRGAADAGGRDAGDARAAVVPGYLAQFRITEADAVTAQWVEADPADARGWALRADVLERLERREAARLAFARWVEADPDSRPARLGLVRTMLGTRRSPAEISPHLDRLLAATPDDPTALRLLAGLREIEGRPDDAAAVLDRVIAAAPTPDAAALMQRARLELDHGRPADALPVARRAVAADPSDVEARFTLFRCLELTGSPEAAEAEAKWKGVRDDLDRARSLARQVSAAPLDPEPRRQMGELFLRNGRTADGLRWLESALAVRPDHPATHAALAAHYDRSGQPERAAQHRARAGRP